MIARLGIISCHEGFVCAMARERADTLGDSTEPSNL